MNSAATFMVDKFGFLDAKAEIFQNLVNIMHSYLSTVNIHTSNPPT